MKLISQNVQVKEEIKGQEQERKIKVVNDRISQINSDIEKLQKKTEGIKESIKEAEAKVEKNVWLGKKYGLNFQDPWEAQQIMNYEFNKEAYYALQSQIKVAIESI